MVLQLSRILLVFFLCFSIGGLSPSFAQPPQDVATLKQNHLKLMTQQLGLLKNRLNQANNLLNRLQHRSEVPLDQISTQMLKQINLDTTIAKSNLDSINIELIESEQTKIRIEKHIQDLENQINILNIFGLKIARNSAMVNLSTVEFELNYQKKLLELEKKRLDFLSQLQTIHNNIIELYKARYRHVESLLKSQTMMRLKEEQEKTEINFQQQQSYWLEELNNFYLKLNEVEKATPVDKNTVISIENNIFFANENVNFTYIQMLIARYQDQIRQYKVAIARSTSISLLNKINEQAEVLGKQLSRVNDLLKSRVVILEKHKLFLTHTDPTTPLELTSLLRLEDQYKSALNAVASLNKQFITFRDLLHQDLQQQLSSRQGIPGLGARAWLDVGEQLLIVPSLTFHIFNGLFRTVLSIIKNMSLSWGIFLIFIEFVFISLFVGLKKYLKKRLIGMVDHEFGHINLKWLGTNLLNRNLIDVALIINIFGLFFICGIAPENFMFLLGIGFVWVFFKSILVAGRLILVESVHDANATADMRLYKYLRWIVYIGGVVTAFSVFFSQLPIIYEVKDLFDRIFLFYVLVVSIFLLKSWRVVPRLILPYIDNTRTYLKRVVYLLGLFIPIILLTNSAVGLFGYVNLVITIFWYESIFLCVTVGYLIMRGLFVELMERFSYLVIRYVTNGWLWTEAFLKPIDRVLRITLFLTAWLVLFILYGWDAQSPVVERLNKLLHYQLLNVLNTNITLLSILEVLVIISLLFWAARWTREFVYRFLMSRTKDMGLRNSISILSQYTMIIIGALICLRVLGIDFRALTVVAGMFFFGVGLGLRDLFNNFACGLLLLIERPLKVGDTVTVNEIEGDVIHIGSRAVTIRTWDYTELLVPNTEIFSKTFINWTGRDTIVRTVLPIKVNRHDNPHEIQALIYEVLSLHKDILKEPAPEVFLKEMGNEIAFEIRYFVNIRHVKSRISVQSDVLSAMWDVFEKHNIQPPYPSHQIVLKQ